MTKLMVDNSQRATCMELVGFMLLKKWRIWLGTGGYQVRASSRIGTQTCDLHIKGSGGPVSAMLHGS